MDGGHSSPAARVFFRTGDTNAGFVSRARRRRELGIEFSRKGTSFLRLHLLCNAWQSFYENVPPGLHSLCITESLI